MGQHRLSRWLPPTALALNILTLNVALCITYLIINQSLLDISDFFKSQFSLFANLCWIVVLVIFKPTYRSRANFNIPNLLIDYTRCVFLLLCFLSILFISFNNITYSRSYLFLLVGIHWLGGFFWRVGGVFALRLYRSLGYNNRNYLIIGDGSESKKVQSYYKQSPELGFKLVGRIPHIDIVALTGFLDNTPIDVIYISLPSKNTQSEIEYFLELAKIKNIEVKAISEYNYSFKNGLDLEYYGYLPVLNISQKPYENKKVELVKRTFDLTVSIIAIILLLPIYLTLALLTKISSPGPIFYKQERVGRWGKPFNIIKFRSMYVDSEKNGPELSTGSKDPRITPLGHFLRKTRLDETPQFFNVILGEMSIVGPRPERKFFIDQIVKEAPDYYQLLTLRPGITSIGQVKYGYASSVKEMIERMRYDLIYLKKFSLEIDLQIILLTCLVMVKGSGK